MPCRNAGPYLLAAIHSVLDQPGLLELLIADAGSTDGSLELAERWSQQDRRLRIVSRQDDGPGDGLNKAFRHARGTLIGWLNADDLYAPGCLARAAAALIAHPDWLMVYGEGEEFDTDIGFRRPYPTVLPSSGLLGLKNHCGICQPTVVWRRSMGALLGPFSHTLRTAFDYDYWLRAFRAFPERIGFIPYLQGSTRLHDRSITNLQRSLVAIETSQLQASYFGSANGKNLHNFGLEVQSGRALLQRGETLSQKMGQLIEEASAYLSPHGKAWLQETWCPRPDKLMVEQHTAELRLQDCFSVQILQIAHPQLALTNPSAPAGPHRRLLAGIEQYWATSLLLLQDDRLQKCLQKQTGSQKPSAVASEHQHWSERPFGVNLIGHAFNVFGLGEDIRMAALALAAADVPFSVIDVPAYNGSATSDRSLEAWITPGPSGPYAFNIVCLQPITHAQWLLRHGLPPAQTQYTISSWPWETDRWPQVWEPLLTCCDELWPASSLIHRALKPMALQHGLPIHTMPMAVDISSPNGCHGDQGRRATRRRFGLPETSTLFVFSFDFNSTTIRKNPRAVIEAFQLAFPAEEELSTALVIKVLAPSSPDRYDWQWLQARKQDDPRINLIAKDLGRADLLSLYACCDAFVSLHRSEGFGRGLAEALQLGLDVVATDHGGNTDFCHGPLAHPVRCRSVPIPPDVYPPADEQHHWAEPDINEAAAILRRVADLSRGRTSRVQESISTYRHHFSPQTVGERYRQRLEAIWPLS